MKSMRSVFLALTIWSETGNAYRIQSPEMSCESLNAERTRLLAERADLKSPLLSSNTDAEREAELTQLNGKLYTIAKAQSDKSCPLIANAPPSPPSAVVQ